MRNAYFFLHARPVYRSSGHSAVAAAAYQANDTLVHENKIVGQLHFFAPKSEVTDEKKKEASEMPLLDPRKALSKGIVTGEFRQALAHQSIGIHVSKDATAVKEGRQYWTIHDRGRVYDIREFTTRQKDPETGKREVVAQGLDVYATRTYNYSRKKDAVQTWVQVPKHAPEPLQQVAAKGAGITSEERQALWNLAEASERRRDGRAAHTIELALSRELSHEENITALRQFVDQELTAHGRIADVAIHRIQASDGGSNDHAHILYTARAVKKDGSLADTKNRRWNGKGKVEEWRQAWADTLNQTFEEKGLDVRVDHRSYAAQGMDRTPGIHIGPVATAIEKRTGDSYLAAYDRKIRSQVAKAVSQMDEETREHIRKRNPGQELYADDLGGLKKPELRFLDSGEPVPQAQPVRRTQRIYRSNEYGRVGPPPITVHKPAEYTAPIPHRNQNRVSQRDVSDRERGEHLYSLSPGERNLQTKDWEDHLRYNAIAEEHRLQAGLSDTPSGQQEIAGTFGNGVGPAAEATVAMHRHAGQHHDPPDQTDTQMDRMDGQIAEVQGRWTAMIRQQEQEQQQQPDPVREQQRREETAKFTEIARELNPGLDHQAREQQRDWEKDKGMDR